MASTLRRDQSTPPAAKRRGTGTLGPSDSTDTGSDIQGGPGLNGDDGLINPPGTTSDPDVDGPGATAGPDIGDANLDSDSDRYGTGERAAVGRDSTLPTDKVLRDEHDEAIDPESIGEEANRERPSVNEAAGSGTFGQDDISPSRAANTEEESEQVQPSGTQPGHDAEPDDAQHDRAQGKRPTQRQDVPVFDRAARIDSPARR